jgi:phosphoserine phosphatase RsbU/P
MIQGEINYNQNFIDLISANKNLDAFEELLFTLFSEVEILTYKIALYDYLEKGKEIMEVKLDREGAYHTFFYHYDRDLASRVSVPSSNIDKYKRIETLVKAILEFMYLKQIKAQKIDTTFLRKDLELASKMQGLLIPKTLFNNDQFKASGLYRPHQQVGGDFYDVYPINEHEIGFSIGDVSGKGVNAAIVMANYQALAKAVLAAENNLLPVIEKLNEKMYHLTEGAKFLTLFLAVYNMKDRRLVYANCGHLPIALYNENEFEWLEKGTTILGAFEKLQFLEYGTKMITENTKLFLYTDGLLNLNYDHEEFLSFKELKYILQKECMHAKTEDVISFFERGIKSIDVEEDLKDDISMLAIEIS